MRHAERTLKEFRMTEKTSALSSGTNCYIFEVDAAASKEQIAHAVREVFGVEPTSVRTMMHKGKAKRSRFTKGGRVVAYRKPHLRKAIVTLKAGEKIEVL